MRWSENVAFLRAVLAAVDKVTLASANCGNSNRLPKGDFSKPAL